jgi:hypothetical protein
VLVSITYRNYIVRSAANILLVETEFPYTITTIESLTQRQFYFIG